MCLIDNSCLPSDPTKKYFFSVFYFIDLLNLILLLYKDFQSSR